MPEAAFRFGDIVVARAGALLREGDSVRPITVEADAR